MRNQLSVHMARVVVQSKGDYCPFTIVVRMERFDATGGASSSPTKSEWDSAVLERLVRGEGGLLPFYNGCGD